MFGALDRGNAEAPTILPSRLCGRGPFTWDFDWLGKKICSYLVRLRNLNLNSEFLLIGQEDVSLRQRELPAQHAELS
jgi:hypothetical protein